MFSQLVGVQVLVEELKEFVDVLQVQKYGIMKNIRILHDCIKNFLLYLSLTYILGGGEEDYHHRTRSWRSLGLVFIASFRHS